MKFLFLFLAICAGAAALAAQDKGSLTPMPLDAGFGRMDVTPPTIPAEEIVRKFSAKETEFKEALNHYTYRRTARLDEIDDDTRKVSGQWYESDDVTFDSAGKRMERVIEAPVNSLHQLIMTPSDKYDIEQGYPFVLTSTELPAYNITYAGRQKVDDLDCYVFDVAPKVIEKNKRYLDGRVWVDASDLQIVVTNGRMVPDGTKKGQEDLHPPFMTWRQQVDGHYWFPVYTKGEAILHFGGGYGAMDQDVHMRIVVKYADYKRYGSSIKVIYEGEDITNKGEQPPTQPQSGGKK